MSRLIIHGGRPLSGSFTPTGNKNAALPMLAACVLTDQPVVLRNVPDIKDVQVMCALLAALGVTVTRRGRTITVDASGLQTTRLPSDLCGQVRGSILLAGPLTARHGQAELAPPGGDVIGRRRIDTHFAGLRELGLAIHAGTRTFRLRRKRLRGAPVLLDEASVTATENLMMAAVLAPGRTTLFNAACEPHVHDLGRLLIKMGAHIEGLGTNRLLIRGVKGLRGATHRLQPDHVELGSFAAAAIATGGRLRINVGGIAPETLQVTGRPFTKLGVRWQARRGILTVGPSELAVCSDLGQAIPKIEDGPWPAIPSDLMSVAIVLATQAKGTMLFFEKMFESRMYFVDALISMGARIVQCDPHRVVVSGPGMLRGTHLATPDIRAGMALLVAACCARGKSVIENAEMIDRGYEAIETRLQSLGADIQRA